MIIDIFCDSINHPILPHLEDWIIAINSDDDKTAKLCTMKDKLEGGDLLFLISCNQIINQDIRKLYTRSLVIHESDLPKGRGWSPLVWQIVEGRDEIVLSMFEAADSVDTGDIASKTILRLDGIETYDEINAKLFKVKLGMMTFAVENFNLLTFVAQDSSQEPSYYRKRTPDDSELDITKSIESQINLLRICDPIRYPAFFHYRGVKYNIKLEKAKG